MRKLLALIFLFFIVPAHAAIVASTATGTSFASSGNVSTFTLNRPSSVNIGDLLFVQITVSANVSVSIVPSGWTLLADDTSGSGGTVLEQFTYYHVATASDTANGATSWTLSAAVRVAAAMVGFRSDLAGRTAVLGATDVDTGGSATLTASDETATAPGRLVRFYGHRSTSALNSGAALTRHASANADTLVTLLAASRAIAGSGATGTDVVTASSSARYVIHSVLLTESKLTKPATCYSDNFSDSTAFAQNWVTTSVGSTAFTPTILSGHMRLTSNNGYISTGATLQRLFPTSNLIYVEFNHYSYPSASGADGIAVTLSDSSITPQPGGFGGSLGYAQRNDSGGINGFAGGWLGVALDEYGNYSNPTEGRNGGPGFRVDSVAIRGSGSGQTGYAYVAGTAAGLSPGIDSTSTPGPGYRYRIVIDAAGSGQTYVTVDRDINGTGNSYTNLIPTFNIESTAGQAAIPANLMLTFTGSTGGSINIHEIGNLSVCATTIQTTNQVDHFEFVHDGQGLTCEPENVTIRACADAACSTLMSVPVTVTLGTSSTTGGWVGGNTKTINSGAGVFQFQRAIPTTGIDPNNLFIASSSPGAKPFSTNKCNGVVTNNCALPFVDAGLAFDVPTLLANKPSGAVRLRAVKNSGDAANSCVALFQNTTQAINFWSTYTTPSTGTRAVELRPGSGSGSFTSVVTAAPGTAINLNFDNSGETTFDARYQDAGLMALNARYNGSGTYAGLVLNGSDTFVSKPAGLCVDTTTSSTTCNSSYNNCAPFVAAGMPFQLHVDGAAWESDVDANFCSGNGTTPNYSQSSVPLSVQLIAPTGSGTNTGTLGRYNATFIPAVVNIANGSAVLTDLTESEVGVFTFTATPPANAYFGETVNNGTSRNIGRFVPYRFAVTSTAAIRNATTCGFTYQDQPFDFDFDTTTSTDYSPVITITALNAANVTTRNYDAGGTAADDTNSFWKLGNSAANSLNTSSNHNYNHLAPPTAGGILNVGGSTTAVVTALGPNDGDGSRSYRITGETFSYARVSTPNAPFNANLQLNVVQNALTEAVSETYLDPTNLSSTDRACYRSNCPINTTNICTNVCGSYGSSAITNRSGLPVVEIRYGRLRANSASGPTTSALPIPIVAEYWNGLQFITNTADNCTAISSSGTALTNYTQNLNNGETTASGSATALIAGQSSSDIVLSAPGTNNYGTVDVSPNLSAIPWLQFDWDHNSATPFTNPTATASFGNYSGSDRIIYWQEIP
jgi:MSHA biogenesis protein MshQ